MKRKCDALDGCPSTNLVCLELCAGCAKLSRSLKHAGFQPIAVDHSKNRHKQLFPTLQIDLASDDAFSQVCSLIGHNSLVYYIHVTPPRGTCSRASERKKPSRLPKRGIPARKPMRSPAYPNGLPTLTGVDKERVEIANAVFRNIGRIVEHFADQCIITIFHPTKSHLWNTTWMKRTITRCNLFPLYFQDCMHGGLRDRWSTCYTNASAFSPLAVVCDQMHTHLPWSVSTDSPSPEPDFPQELCDKICTIVSNMATNAGAVIQKPATQAPGTFLSSKLRSAEAGRQPRGNMLPQIISEFAEIVHLPWNKPSCKCPRLLTEHEADTLRLPFQAKLLSFEKGDTSTDNDTLVAKIGIFRTTDQFTEEALALQHPFDGDSTVCDDTKRAIFWTLTQGCSAVEHERQKLFDHYEALKASFSDMERQLHSTLDLDRERIVADKQVLLFQRMCKDAGIEDESVHDILLNGLKLTGVGDSTDLFEPDLKEPAMSNVQLMKSTRWTRKKILERKSNEDAEVISEVWAGAMDEVQRGWLSGPFSEEQLCDYLGPMFVVSRRFGLKQSDKLRAIDDMSESLVNSAYGSSYKLDLPGIDGIATTARTWVESVGNDRIVRMKLSDGRVLTGPLHRDLSVEDAKALRGRTLDLESAYKQLLTAKASLWCSVLAVEEPSSGGKKLFVSNVIPFGSSSSVFGFNRLSRCIFLIGLRIFGLVWCNFYDDYPQLDIGASGDNSQLCAERLLALLGWKVSFKPTKRAPFADRFDALGVTFDFSCCHHGIITVKNKLSRVHQILSELTDVLRKGELTIARAVSLRGKLQFAETHTFGRVLAAHLKHFNRRASGQFSGGEVTAELRSEIDWIRMFLQEDCPRQLRTGMSDRKLCIFTDASLEDDGARGGVGMSAFYVEGNKVLKSYFFSDIVPASVMKIWQVNTPRIIATLELFAAVWAVKLLSDFHQHVRVFLFVDNEAARASLISMKSSIEAHRQMMISLSDSI